MRRFFAVLLAALVTVAMNLAQAEMPWMEALDRVVSWVDDRYAAYLPPFCLARLPSAPEEYKKIDWRRMYGEDFVFSNHYCNAKAKRHICYNYSGKSRRDCLISTMEGATYGIRASRDPNFALLPIYYADLGFVYHEIEEYPKAIDEFRKAIRLNPRYLAAYSAMADSFMKMGNNEEALKVVNEGLKFGADKPLEIRKKKLEAMAKDPGGKDAPTTSAEKSSIQ